MGDMMWLKRDFRCVSGGRAQESSGGGPVPDAEIAAEGFVHHDAECAASLHYEED